MSNNNDVPIEQLATASFNYRYYKDSSGLLNILLLSTICLLLMVGFYVFIQFFLQPKPLHFKLGPNLQITDPIPLDQRGISDAALLNRVNQVVNDAFSFNYSNVDQQPAKLYQYFSSAAMKIYTDLLINDEGLSSIAVNKFVVSIVPTAAPEIIIAKAFKGRFAWQIKVPARVVFSNALIKSSQNVVLNFLIWRVPETESPLGVLIATFTYEVEYRSVAQGVK